MIGRCRCGVCCNRMAINESAKAALDQDVAQAKKEGVCQPMGCPVYCVMTTAVCQAGTCTLE